MLLCGFLKCWTALWSSVSIWIVDCWKESSKSIYLPVEYAIARSVSWNLELVFGRRQVNFWLVLIFVFMLST